jgi:hypothetical protein
LFIGILLTLLSCARHGRNCWYLRHVVVYFVNTLVRAWHLRHFVLVVLVIASTCCTHNYLPYFFMYSLRVMPDFLAADFSH